MKRLVLLSVGHVAFGLGFLGLFLPLLPTTGFWVLAVICYARVCPVLRDKLYAWPGVGPTLRRYVEEGSLSPRAKAAALSGMAVGGGLSALALWTSGAPVWLSVAVVGLIGLGALFVGTRPTSIGDQVQA